MNKINDVKIKRMKGLDPFSMQITFNCVWVYW